MSPIAPILYAEDDENDAFLMERAFRLAEIENPLEIVVDGQLAIDYLSGTKKYADRTRFPLPRLLLLDVNLPRKSGLEVLKWVRSTPATCTMPVLILTSSSQEKDIHRAYILGVNSYLVKPGKPDELLDLVNSIKDFWLTMNSVAQR
jgi:DNA-binding response OmpR family regulator